MSAVRDDKGRYLKGGPGNKQATGRPPVVRSLSELIRRSGESDFQKGRTRNQALADGLWDMALKGESEKIRLAATREILDRTEGRPPVKVDVTTDGNSLVKGYPVELLEQLA